MRQIKDFGPYETSTSFNEGIESVLYIRCMGHRLASQLNMVEDCGSECGECIRQQCFRDILQLIDRIMPDIDDGVTGKGALVLLRSALQVGIGTFGVADELENAHASAVRERS